MTIPEAAQLVIQAGFMAKGGEVFLLEMGEPVAIKDLATMLIQLSGKTVRSADHPEGEIEITYTGLREGEKLYEELLVDENATGSEHPKIMCSIERSIDQKILNALQKQLESALEDRDESAVRNIMRDAVIVRSKVQSTAQLRLVE